jgi:hypothetical protein
MEVVIRPVNDRFLQEVAFPAFESGVIDAVAGLEVFLEHLSDEHTRALIEMLLERGVEGSFFSLEEDKWIEAVYRILFWEWIKENDGWTVSAEYVGFAGDWDLSLHLALMLEQPYYPYHDEKQSRDFRQEFLQTPEAEMGLASLIAGSWDPCPSFPPDQVLATQGRGIYHPQDKIAIADWSWRPLHTVNAWGAQLPNKLSRLLSRETKRLHPIEAPETHEILDFWLGRAANPPLLAVSFSGLGQSSSTWIREIGALARMIRSAAAMEQGITSIVSTMGRSMADG